MAVRLMALYAFRPSSMATLPLMRKSCRTFSIANSMLLPTPYCRFLKQVLRAGMTASTAMRDIAFAHTHSAPIGRNFLFGFRSTVRLVALRRCATSGATFPLAMSVRMAVISMRSALSFVRGYSSSRVQPSRPGAAPRVRRLSIILATSLLSNVTRGALTAGSGYVRVSSCG
ncbi:hypothetical protein C3747_395g16 [Trypanosoma cruzi]|uniref:Uncharacterized protein n=1 Tax=Trypanosoma cruzi TaxID=5693 RepID=A0A2V2UZI3_TRYCR|nr:hypothetical protein C3747_395g16 [Trypanosoma cruzi]